MAHVRGFRALIMGLPGSGKGHISEKIVQKYGAVHISAGDILRNHINNRTPLGKVAENLTRQGILVPDHLIQGVIATAIYKAGDYNFILDGYPRTLAQAKHLESLVHLDMVIKLVIPHSTIVEMLKMRLVHVPSGRVYNEGEKAPLVPGLDDITGEKLIRRPDDNPSTVLARLEAFDRHMQPVIRFYRRRNILVLITGRLHRNLWPLVEKYMDRRLGKSASRSFRTKRNIDLIQFKK